MAVRMSRGAGRSTAATVAEMESLWNSEEPPTGASTKRERMSRSRTDEAAALRDERRARAASSSKNLVRGSQVWMAAPRIERVPSRRAAISGGADGMAVSSVCTPW